MRRETQKQKRQRLNEICGRLASAYPDAHCELDFATPLQLLIATILSAQSTDRQVNIVTRTLFQKYASAADFAAVPLETLENDLRAIGLFRNKARNIKACCQQLVERFQGTVPASMDALIALPGVGRKTANVVLSNAFDIQEGIVVDTHVSRLSQRLNLTSEVTPEKIEPDLCKLVPKEHWGLFSHWLIWHGRRRCRARCPDCPSCEIAALCPSRTAEIP